MLDGGDLDSVPALVWSHWLAWRLVASTHSRSSGTQKGCPSVAVIVAVVVPSPLSSSMSSLWVLMVMERPHGLPGPVAGSVNLHPLKQAVNSRDGDVSYGTGWTEAAMSAVVAIPDVTGDQVPDLWVRDGSDGQIRVYHPSKTSAGSAVKVVLGSDWSGMKSFG